jgi:hypothetical protein
MDPPASVWDLGGFLITEKEVDGQLNDSIMMGGVALNGGLLAGAMEHMVSIHFTPTSPGGSVYSLCFDSAFILPAGAFVYVDDLGSTFTPKIAPATCVFVYDPALDADGDDRPIPLTFGLDQNFPNPFNPSTKIKYSVAKKGMVNLAVFNILGQKVVTLVNQEQEAAEYTINWDSKDESGQEVASGIYFYKMTAGDFVETRKMVLMR